MFWSSITIEMQFQRIDPRDKLKNLVECFWIMESDDPAPFEQKIISDGFPELIFHFADPYEVKLRDQWTIQPLSLVAGQITRYFYLRNTGRTDILGIKLKPSGLTKLFNISMHELTDQLVPFNFLKNDKLNELEISVRGIDDHLQRIEIIHSQLSEMISPAEHHSIDDAIAAIFATQGVISVTDICAATGTSERQLERLFKKYIGLSPKFYSRVIRFSNIFQLAQKKKMSFSELGYESGFYDQSHFIKNFKTFTGEDPSRYFFDEPNMANFFLKK